MLILLIRRGAFAALVATLLVLPASAMASNSYVLKHPKREHCRVHYLRRSKTVRVKIHGRRVKRRRIVCVFRRPVPVTPVGQPKLLPLPPPPSPAPSPPSPAPVPFTPVPLPNEGPFATKTLLRALFVKGSCPSEGAEGTGEAEVCEWKVGYTTRNGNGEAPPGPGPILRVLIPPEPEQTLDIPSETTIQVRWVTNASKECELSIAAEGTVRASGKCDPKDPRAILTASYGQPATGWLASTSVEVTVR